MNFANYSVLPRPVRPRARSTTSAVRRFREALQRWIIRLESRLEEDVDRWPRHVPYY